MRSTANCCFFFLLPQRSGRLLRSPHPSVPQRRMPNRLRPSSVSVTHQQGKSCCCSLDEHRDPFSHCFHLFTSVIVHVVQRLNKGVHLCVRARVSAQCSVGVLANLHRLSECSLASAGWQADMQRERGVMPFPSRQNAHPPPRRSHTDSPSLPVQITAWPTGERRCIWLCF